MTSPSPQVEAEPVAWRYRERYPMDPGLDAKSQWHIVASRPNWPEDGLTWEAQALYSEATLTVMLDEREAAIALNNKYAWERDKAREERDAAERKSEAFWKPRLGAAEAQLAAMREALEPFAEAAEDAVDDNSYRDHDNIWESPVALSLTHGNLRRARSALTNPEPMDGDAK